MRNSRIVFWTGTLVLVGSLVCPSGALARSSYLSSALAKYPFITDTRIDSCLLCHTTDVDPDAGNLQAYGSSWDSNGGNTAAFGRIETLNADGGAFNNLQEIFARTFPGNASDTPSPSANQVDLIAAGTTWKYLDNGSNQGTVWRETGFDDATWASNPAQLGYGNVGEVSVVSFGPSSSNKYVTTYFRYSLDRSASFSYSNAVLRVLKNDGVVVYLNGVEILRSSLPAGPVAYNTLATAEQNAWIETAFDGALLAEGTNVFAVETHQASASGPSIGFKMQLQALETSVTRARDWVLYE